MPSPLLASLQETLGDWCGELSLRKDLLRRVASRRLQVPPAGATNASVGGAGRTLQLREPGFPSPSGILSPSFTPPPAPPIQAAPRRVCRNDPCPCGSGRKYKNCCGK